MKAALTANFTGFFLVMLSVACVIYGFHSGNSALSKLGEGAFGTAMLALKISTTPAQVPDPKE